MAMTADTAIEIDKEAMEKAARAFDPWAFEMAAKTDSTAWQEQLQIVRVKSDAAIRAYLAALPATCARRPMLPFESAACKSAQQQASEQVASLARVASPATGAEQWRPKVRWDGNKAHVGEVPFGKIYPFTLYTNDKTVWIARGREDNPLGHFPTGLEARAAVEAAAIEALTRE